MDWSVRFKYKADGENREDVVRGVTYYPMTEGEYTLVYDAELKDKILTSSMTLNVYGNPPEIVISDYPLVYELGDTVKFSLLLMAANPYSPDVNAFKMEKVNYYTTNVDFDETVNENSKYERVFTDDDKEFTFDEYGTYVFTFSGTAGDKTSYETLRVEIVPDGRGNEDVLKENGEYVMKNAVLSDDRVRLVQAEYSNASYVVMDGEYYDQDVIRVEFKGKNCPNIGFLTIPDEQAFNPYDLFSGYGFTFSMEHLYTDKFSIYGYGVDYGKGVGRFAGMNLHNGNSVTGYMGRDDLENDKYYAIELNIDSGSVESLLTVFHLRIFELTDYGTAEQSQKLVYTADVPAGNTAEGKLEKGRLVFYGSAKEDIVFKYVMPTTKVQNFVRDGNTVTWDAVDGAEYYVSTDGTNYTKQSENSFTFENFIPELTPLYVKTGFPGTTLLGGAAVFNTEENMPYDGDDFVGSPSAGVFSTNVNGDIKHVNATAPFISGAKQSYIATKADYAPGTYFMMEFRGSDCPGRIIFGASGLDETADSIIGTGFTFDNNWGSTAYYKKDAATAADVSMTGDRFISGGKINRAFFTGNAGISASYAGNQSCNFILAVCADNTEGGVTMTYYLYKLVGAGELEFIENSKLFVAGATLAAGKIAVVSSNTDPKITTRVKLHLPASLGEIDALLYAKYGTHIFDVNDHFIATAGAQAQPGENGGIDVTLPFISGLQFNYVATKQQYSAGTYVLMEFKGGEYPAKILFGASNLSDKPDVTVGTGWNPDANVFAAYYYHKPDAATDVFRTGVANGKLTRGFLNEMSDSFGDVTGNKQEDFVLMAGAENVTGGILLSYSLFEKQSDGLVLIESKEITTQGGTLADGSIVIAGTNVVPTVNTKVRLYTPDTKQNVTALLNRLYTVKQA